MALLVRARVGDALRNLDCLENEMHGAGEQSDRVGMRTAVGDAASERVTKSRLPGTAGGLPSAWATPASIENRKIPVAYFETGT